MNALSLYSDGEIFAVDVALVQKVVRQMVWTRVPAAPDAVVGLANLKGGIVTLLSLSELLGRSRSAQAVHAIIFEPFTDGYGQMGLLVDHPSGLVTIDEAEVIPPPPTADEKDEPIISGLSELGGTLYRIIDVDSAGKGADQRPSRGCG